ncbi:MAG: hypothetical protein WDA75_00245 [Candidatus Latescibacterota bacterium]
MNAQLDRPAPGRTASVAVLPEDSAWDCFDDLHEGIRYALSWTELEAWVAQANRAHAMGQLDAAELEHLTELAIRVSRAVPER